MGDRGQDRRYCTSVRNSRKSVIVVETKAADV